MPRRVLITGITGFVGSHLAERSLAAGDEVHGLAFEEPPYRNLHAVVADVRVHRGDIRDAASVRAAVDAARPDVVFHLAGQAVPTLAAGDPLAAVRVNVVGTATVAAALRDWPGTALVFASSAEVYDPAAPPPYTEDAPVRAPNVYAATKVAAEAIVRELGDSGANAATIVRPANQIGPRLHPGLVASAFARQIALAEAGRAEPVIRHGRLDSRRDFVDVRDMADAFLRAAALEHARTALYNAGTGEPVSIADVLRTLVGLARVAVEVEPDPARMRDGDPSTLSLDSARLRERTGWRPTIPLERSLADTLGYWRDEIDRARSGFAATSESASLERGSHRTQRAASDAAKRISAKPRN